MNLVCTCGESVASWAAAKDHVVHAEGRHEVAEMGQHATRDERLLREVAQTLYEAASDLRHLGLDHEALGVESSARDVVAVAMPSTQENDR